MIFSKPKTETIEFTVEKCSKCGKFVKRPYKEGDVLFSEIRNCDSCDGNFHIDMIYGEVIEK